MADFKITPGPWEGCVGEMDDVPVGSVHGPKGLNSFAPVAMVVGPDAVANARAIAALPELLDVLKRAEKELLWASDQFHGGIPTLVDCAREIRSILSSIKQADNG